MLAIDAVAGGLAFANTIYATVKFYQFKAAGHPFKSVPIITLGILIIASIGKSKQLPTSGRLLFNRFFSWHDYLYMRHFVLFISCADSARRH